MHWCLLQLLSNSLLDVQLFVKNIPLNRSLEELKGMFSQFGRVHGVVPVAGRKNVVYVVRDII